MGILRNPLSFKGVWVQYSLSAVKPPDFPNPYAKRLRGLWGGSYGVALQRQSDPQGRNAVPSSQKGTQNGPGIQKATKGTQKGPRGTRAQKGSPGPQKGTEKGPCTKKGPKRDPEEPQRDPAWPLFYPPLLIYPLNDGPNST